MILKSFYGIEKKLQSELILKDDYDDNVKTEDRKNVSKDHSRMGRV